MTCAGGLDLSPAAVMKSMHAFSTTALSMPSSSSTSASKSSSAAASSSGTQSPSLALCFFSSRRSRTALILAFFAMILSTVVRSHNLDLTLVRGQSPGCEISPRAGRESAWPWQGVTIWTSPSCEGNVQIVKPPPQLGRGLVWGDLAGKSNRPRVPP